MLVSTFSLIKHAPRRECAGWCGVEIVLSLKVVAAPKKSFHQVFASENLMKRFWKQKHSITMCFSSAFARLGLCYEIF